MIKENSRKKNLLFVLHSFDILFSSGKSIEEAVGLIAKSHYGTISNDFSMIIAKTKNNYINIDSALLELKQKTKVKNYRLLLEYLAFSYKKLAIGKANGDIILWKFPRENPGFTRIPPHPPHLTSPHLFSAA